MPQFPTPVRINGRLYIRRLDLEDYKAGLVAAALGSTPHVRPSVEPDCLIPLKQVAAELGVGRRTIGRRIAESHSHGVDNAAGL
jgi:hypothetical protein